MELLNYMLIGLQLIIERLIIYLHLTAYYLTMKVLQEVKLCFKKNYQAVAEYHKEVMKYYILVTLGKGWGHAKDYVEGMWKILQHETPETLF